jgi:hypothetical protein
MSTQTQGVKSPPLRGYRRRKTVLDLNAPPTEGRGDEGTSSRTEPQGVQASQQGQSLPPPTIDVDVFDDDVIESSPTAFAEVHSLSLFSILKCSFVLRNFFIYYLFLFHSRLRTKLEELVEGLLLLM